MADINPSRTTMTLFFKSGKTVTLLYANSSTPLYSLKTELFRLLKENGQHLDIDLPESADDITFGAMIDPAGLDIHLGFHVVTNQEKRKTTVKDAGFKDGCTVAWRLKSEEGFDVISSAYEDLQNQD